MAPENSEHVILPQDQNNTTRLFTKPESDVCAQTCLWIGHGFTASAGVFAALCDHFLSCESCQQYAYARALLQYRGNYADGS